MPAVRRRWPDARAGSGDCGARHHDRIGLCTAGVELSPRRNTRITSANSALPRWCGTERPTPWRPKPLASWASEFIELRVPRDGPAGAFEIVEVSAAARDLNIRQTDQAMIFQTSATTGVPKLVPRSHAALEILRARTPGALELSAADRYLNLISLTHAAGPDAIFAQLVSGGSVFCTPGFREGRLCGMAGCISADLVPGYAHHPSRDSSGSPANETGDSRPGSASGSCAPAARPPILN